MLTLCYRNIWMEWTGTFRGECCWTKKTQVIGCTAVSIGSLNRVNCGTREVFKVAILANCARYLNSPITTPVAMSTIARG